MPPPASIVTRRRRRRGVALVVVATACGALAAVGVHDTVEEVESRTGQAMPVVVAAQEIAAGTTLDRRRVTHALTVREIPARYAPRGGLSSPTQVLGLESAVDVPAGAYVTAPMLRDPRAAAAPVALVRRGERLVELPVSGGREFAAAGVPARVDVVVTTEGRSGRGRTFVALEDVELVSARPVGSIDTADVGGAPADTLATLRVSARAAVFLTNAQNFAREVRLLARPPGDRRRVGRAEVGGGRP